MRLRFLFSDPLARRASGDTVIRWRPDRYAPLAEQTESEYVLYLRENDGPPEAVVQAVDQIDVAYQGASSEDFTVGDLLDALAVKLRPQTPKYREKWVVGIGLYGSGQEFRAELAKPELQRRWTEPMRKIARYLTESGAQRPPTGELVRAATAMAPTRPQFLFPLARTAVERRRLDLFDKETLDRMAGISHRDEQSRARVMAILNGARHAEWIEALEPWDVWDLLNLRLALRDFAGATDLLRFMHGKWKGSGTWGEDLQAFWRTSAALNTPDDACLLALQVQSTDLPSYMLFDLLVVSLKRYSWNSLELVTTLSSIYSEQNLPADRTEALLDLVVGLLPYNADALVNQVVIKALKRLIDKPEGRELTRRLGRMPHREGLYIAVMRVARAMDVKTLEGFYRLLSYERMMARERAGVRSLLIAAARIKRGGPMGFLQRLAPHKRFR